MKLKLDTHFQTLVFSMAILVLVTPYTTFAQEGALQAEAQAAAERDAENDVDTNAWFRAGCVGVGLVAAPVAKPNIPAERLTGKSPEYVAFYTEAYIAKAKNLQSRSAAKGCIVSSVITVAVAGALLVVSFVVLDSIN